jgi:DNA-binding transcriptional LysR family regulator
MELRQLTYFEAVVRHGGFTRASEQLRVAQPAVSAQIRRLEAELGTTLLRRTTRQVALTDAGELFLVRVRRVLEQLDGARAELDDLHDVLRGQVRLGATQVLGDLDLSSAMARFRHRYPGVRLALRSGLIAELLAALDAGEIDLLVGPIHDGLPDRYVATRLAAETLVLITAVGRPAPSTPITTLAEVRDEPFVCLPPGSGLHAILTEAAAVEGFNPRIDYHTHSPASIRELVAAGLGVALLARSATQPPGPPIETHALACPPKHPPIGIIGRHSEVLTPATRAFEQQLSGERASR